MLDVHAPHEGIHTWKAFLIHIATIVVGLVIAVGLEQTVEYFHHRHQVAEVRESLLIERRINANRFSVLTDEFHRFVPVLEANLRIFRYLRVHPNALTAQLPGKLDWLALSISFVDTAWKTAQQSTILQYMPREEVMRDDVLYSGLHALDRRIDAAQAALNNARRFSIVDPDASHLSAAQIDRQIDLTAEVLLQYALAARTGKNLAGYYPDFSHSPTRDDVYGILHATTDPNDQAAINALGERLRRFEEEQGVEPHDIPLSDQSAGRETK
jgi:hypothetical protein